MQQFQFMVDGSGLLTEAPAADLAKWYASLFSSVDPLDFEAHLMLVRAYDVLKTDAPFERRGGLTKARYEVLRMLYVATDQRVLMTEIVQCMNVSPTNITKLVDGLERDGYVRRVGNLNDKRKVWVELLPSGADIVQDTMPEVVVHVQHLWQGLTDEEKRVLVHLLAKLRLDILTRGAGEHVEGVSTTAVGAGV